MLGLAGTRTSSTVCASESAKLCQVLGGNADGQTNYLLFIEFVCPSSSSWGRCDMSVIEGLDGQTNSVFLFEFVCSSASRSGERGNVECK